MNQDQIAGNWKQLKGTMQQKWGKFTDDDVAVIQGQSTQLSGKLQEHYGLAKEEAEKQAAEFWASAKSQSK